MNIKKITSISILFCIVAMLTACSDDSDGSNLCRESGFSVKDCYEGEKILRGINQ